MGDGNQQYLLQFQIGRGLIFLKVLAMGDELLTINGQIDGTDIFTGSVRGLVYECCDFQHSFYDMIFAIDREEALIPSRFVMDTVRLIFSILKPGSLKGMRVLKDGDSASMANELNLIEQDCKVHKCERKHGTGTLATNGCGSVGRFLYAKSLDDQDSVYFL